MGKGYKVRKQCTALWIAAPCAPGRVGMQGRSKPLTPQNLCMDTTPSSQDILKSSVDFIQVSIALSPVLYLLLRKFLSFINNLSQLAA